MCTLPASFSAIDEFLVYSTEQRLARRLLEAGQHAGISPVKASQISISQQELGALIGISRQSVNKILKTWESRGWIKRIYRGVEITDLSALRAQL